MNRHTLEAMRAAVNANVAAGARLDRLTQAMRDLDAMRTERDDYKAQAEQARREVERMADQKALAWIIAGAGWLFGVVSCMFLMGAR